VRSAAGRISRRRGKQAGRHRMEAGAGCRDHRPLYGSALAFLSLLATGAGHGTYVPLLLSTAPFGACGFVTQLLAAPFLWARFVVGGAILPRQAAASKSGYRPAALRLRACAFRDARDELAHLEFVLRLSPELIAVWAWSGRWRCGGELAGRGPSANRLATGAIGGSGWSRPKASECPKKTQTASARRESGTRQGQVGA
jgi:hypothetical protein